MLLDIHLSHDFLYIIEYKSVFVFHFQDFNNYLDNLSEHYDIPKVSWTKWAFRESTDCEFASDEWQQRPVIPSLFSFDVTVDSVVFVNEWNAM